MDTLWLDPSRTVVVTITTDGSCGDSHVKGLGPGGWGVVLRSGKHYKELRGGDPETTNNRMELTATIQGLSALKHPSSVTIRVDSEYVRRGMTEWLEGWLKRGWHNSKRKPVKNKDLWLELLEAAEPHGINWVWVKGHSGDTDNERADALAEAAQMETLWQIDHSSEVRS